MAPAKGPAVNPRAGILFIVLAVFGCAGLRAAETSSFPFEFTDGLIWVKVSAAGSTLNFVLDSGAGSSVLSLQAARRLAIKLGSPVPVQAVEGLTTGYRVNGFPGTVGGISLKGDILALDLQSASKECHRPIDGLIGQDFFRGRVVRIDFKTRRVSLLESANASCCSAVLPIRRLNDALCVPVGLNGQKPKWTRLDTGCDSALEWAANLGGEKHMRNLSVGLAVPSGNSISADVQLGAEHIRNVRTGVHKKQMFSGEAGLLGSGLLSKYCVTIDSREMRLLLERL